MKPTAPAAAVVALLVALTGCARSHRAYPIRSLADQADDHAPPSLPQYPATTDHTRPKPVPLAGVLVQVPSSQVLKGVEDVVVHARRPENDDGSGVDKGLGFTALVTTPDTHLPKRPDPRHRSPFQVGLKTSEVKVAMPFGVGLLRGLRPRLTTAVLAAGSESSTLIASAGDRSQWVALIQFTPTNTHPGFVTLLSESGAPLETKHFTGAITVIAAEVYAEDDQGKPLWRLLDPKPITPGSTIDKSCREAWKRAQASMVIPANEPYPG